MIDQAQIWYAERMNQRDQISHLKNLLHIRRDEDIYKVDKISHEVARLEKEIKDQMKRDRFEASKITKAVQ